MQIKGGVKNASHLETCIDIMNMHSVKAFE